MKKKKITGSEAIVLSLIQEGVDLMFGYPGGAIMPTYDALYDAKDRLRHILVRHEQGAAHAAEGYARVSGKPGVCLATSGPGATNLVTGIADAMLDSVPLICITGQVTSSFLGTDAFQETDILSITAAITKWSYQVTSAEEIPFSIAKAFHIAKSGRPGPVLIDITKDAQIGLLEFSYSPFSEQKVKTSLSKLIKEAAELINQASKPYLLVGHGVLIAGAEKELMCLAERAGIPVACTLLGLSAFPTNHPMYMGMLGMHGNYGPNILTNEADVIIAVGMRFDDRVTGCLKNYAKQAKIIHIEIDEAEINKNVKVTIPLLADAKQALQELLPHIQVKTHPLWLEKFKQCAELESKEVIENEIHPHKGHITMAEVIHSLSIKNTGKAIIVSDVGQHQMVAARYHAFTQTNSHITSGGLGTMGFALPAAIGAKLAAMDREVVAIVGDGGFQMNIQELGVISQEHLPVKIIILNNQYLGMVRQWQELFFECRYSCTEMHNPDFIKISEGYGILARKVVDRSELNGALDEMLEAREAYLLEIVVEKQHKVFPMIPSGASVSEVRLK
ncbi:MAG: biosynthetic-type acetolactate synthase large subunit [Candidatus Rhabdochlamydia sp.]